MKRRRIIMSLVLSLATAQTAFAHAKLVSASPAVGGTVKGAPHSIDLTFGEAISAKLSGATVKGSDGKLIPLTIGLDKSGKGMAVNLKASLRPGVYTVDWHAVASDDGHRTSGTYNFKVQ